MNDILLSLKEAAQQLSIGHTKMCELIASGEVESIKVGKRRLIPRKKLEEFVERALEEQIQRSAPRS